MAKQPQDPLKIQYKSLVKVNQRLRNISDIYYIGTNGILYMHSLVPFIEKIAVIHNPEALSLYSGIMYLPNQLHEFSKDAKITKLTAFETDIGIHLGQVEDSHAIKLNRLYRQSNGIPEDILIQSNILPQMYTHLHHIIADIDTYDFLSISEELISAMLDNQLVSIFDNIGLYVPMSKNLFPSIKKGDIISYTTLPLKDEKIDSKVYVLFKKVTPEMTIYTLSAYLKI